MAMMDGQNLSREAIVRAIRADIEGLSCDGFPLEAFPAYVQDMLIDFVTYCNCKIDYIAASLIAVAAAAIGNSYHLNANNTWTVTPSLYWALVGYPSQGKSHPLKFALQPLFDRDAASLKLFKKEVAEYNSRMETWKNDKNSDAEKPVKPILKKVVYGDFTPEAIWSAHSRNLRSIMLYSDELIGLFSMAMRYNQSPLIQQLMSAWSNTPIDVTRKGSDIPEFVEQPCVCITGTTQPDKFQDMLNNGHRNDGCLDRIIFVYPLDETPIGLSYSDERTKAAADDVFTRWKNFVEKIFALQFIPNQPHVLRFTPEAERRFTEWHNAINHLSSQADTPSYVRNREGKRSNNALRIALVLQVMQWASEDAELTVVDEKALTGAMALMEYFDEGYYRLWDNLFHCGTPGKENEFLELVGESFTTADAMTAGKMVGICRKTVNNWLKRFCERGIIEKVSHGEYRTPTKR